MYFLIFMHFNAFSQLLYCCHSCLKSSESAEKKYPRDASPPRGPGCQSPPERISRLPQIPKHWNISLKLPPTLHFLVVFNQFQHIPPQSLTASFPLKRYLPAPNRKGSSSNPPFFRGDLDTFGEEVYPTHLLDLDRKKPSFIPSILF